MSVAICSWSSTSVPFPLEKKEVLGSLVMSVPTMIKNDEEEVVERPPGQFDIWTSIQAHKAKQSKEYEEPYVHPLVKKHSSSLMTQKSLQVCTESLGSETGSDNYYSSPSDDDDEVVVDVDYSTSSSRRRPTKQVAGVDEHAGVLKRKEHAAASVNYHCSAGGRRSPSRSFPPPLPSISCRDGPCVQMRPRRKDGRLVVEAVAVPSQNYLHAERQGGRLLLSFIKNATPAPKRNASTDLTTEQSQLQVVDEEDVTSELEDQEEEEEEEEEVEVVDRGTVVEVKVSTQPQKHGGGDSAAMKVHRSSIVINKFVSRTPSSSGDKEKDRNQVDVVDDCETSTSLRRSATGTTTAAAAAVAASSLSTFPADGSQQPFSDNKLLFTTKRRNGEELLTDMKRCSRLRKPLFIWETCCIATSS